jgi:hypothetical protein
MQVLTSDDPSATYRRTPTAAYRRTLEQFGIEPLGSPVKIGEPLKPTRISILRNKEKWKVAAADDIRKELAVARPGMDNPSDYLLSLAAEAEEPGG